MRIGDLGGGREYHSKEQTLIVVRLDVMELRRDDGRGDFARCGRQSSGFQRTGRALSLSLPASRAKRKETWLQPELVRS